MIKYSLVTLLLASITASAATGQSPSVKGSADHYERMENREIRALTLEVRALRRDIARLEEKITAASWGAHEPPHNNKKWGCFMQDIRAGGLSATGSTRAEAMGLLLERCSEKGGACFESSARCSDE